MKDFKTWKENLSKRIEVVPTTDTNCGLLVGKSGTLYVPQEYVDDDMQPHHLNIYSDGSKRVLLSTTQSNTNLPYPSNDFIGAVVDRAIYKRSENKLIFH